MTEIREVLLQFRVALLVNRAIGLTHLMYACNTALDCFDRSA
jgi:hypothetical protein